MSRQLWREVRRQAVHLLGALFVLPILFFELQTALKILVVFILLALLASWYYEKRQLRNKYFKEMIGSMDLPEPDKKQLLKNAEKFEKFERSLLHSFLKQFRRRREKQPFFATFAFLLSSTICLILFGREIAIFAILTLAFGDAASALVGTKFGKTKIFWNKDLSVEGSLAFFAAAALAIYFFSFWQGLTIDSIIPVSIIAAGTGALVETIPTVNDNTLIPLAVGTALWIFSFV